MTRGSASGEAAAVQPGRRALDGRHPPGAAARYRQAPAAGLQFRLPDAAAAAPGLLPPPQPARQPQYAPGPAPRRKRRVFLWVFLGMAAALLAAVRGGVTILMSTGRITHLEASLELLRASA